MQRCVLSLAFMFHVHTAGKQTVNAAQLNTLYTISDQPTATAATAVNYRNDLICDWIITRPAGSAGPVNVNIYFQRLDTEPNLDVVQYVRFRAFCAGFGLSSCLFVCPAFGRATTRRSLCKPSVIQPRRLRFRSFSIDQLSCTRVVWLSG